MSVEVNRLGPLFEGFQKGYTEALGTATKVSNTFTLDLASGNVFDISLTANSTIALTGRATVGTVYSFVIVVRQLGGPFSLGGPASFKYSGGVAPTYSINSVNILTGITVDGGVTFLMSAAGFLYS